GPAPRTFSTIAWRDFLVNLPSGAARFTWQATTYGTDGTFLLKMACVLAGAATVGYLQPAIARLGDSHGADSVVPRGVKIAGVISLAVWAGAVITGRLIAYL